MWENLQVTPSFVTIIPSLVTIIPSLVTIIPYLVTIIPYLVTIIPYLVTIIPSLVTIIKYTFKLQVQVFVQGTVYWKHFADFEIFWGEELDILQSISTPNHSRKTRRIKRPSWNLFSIFKELLLYSDFFPGRKHWRWSFLPA